MKKILIVEDEAVTAKDIESTLQALGYEVAGLADTGEEAVEKALSVSPDLILMDIKLRGRLTGIDAAAMIMEKSQVPVVYLTAFADPETLKNAKLTYPFGYLVKPFEDSQLRAVIETTLARAEMSGSLKKSRELLFSTLKSIVDGVVVADEAGRITFLNSTAEALTGWTEREAVGLDLETVLTLNDEISGARIDGIMARVLSEGFDGSVSSHAVLASRHGGAVPVEDSTAVVRDQAGMVSGVILVFRDVTEKRRVQRSRQKYVDLYENASDLFFTCDSGGAITSINGAAVSAFGYSGKAELYAAGLEKLFSRDSYELLMKMQSRLKADSADQEALGTLRLEGRRRSGEFFPVELKLTPMTREGLLVGVHGVGRDVTEQRRAERRLRKSEERYRSLYNKMPVMLSLADVDENILDVNEEWLRATGHQRSEVIGRPLSDFIPGGGRGFIRRRAAGGQGIDGLPVQIARKDGGELDCVLYCSPELNEKGEMVGWMAAYSDITERRRAERALSTSEKLLDNIINSLDEAVLVVSPEKTVLSVNRAGEEMFGYGIAELTGKSAELLNSDPAQFWVYSRHLDRAQGGAVPSTFEFRMRRRNGEVFPTEQTLSPLRGDSGRVTAVVATIRDITARKKSEEELRQKEEQLRHTQKMELVGQLISGVAHELNNPLASIVGYAQLLAKKRGLPKDTAEDLRLISQSATQARRIVENLLRFVRKEESEVSRVPVLSMVNSVLELMRYRLKKGKVADLQVSVPKDLRLYCRAQQIEQVLGNLVSNAIDAMNSGGGERRSLRISAAAEGGLVRISVVNNGPEIPADIREKIFEPFFTTKKASEGTGLGLSLCRQIAESHGGRIWAETPPGGGAAFVLQLPPGRKSAAAAKPARHRTRAASGLEILVVDDEERVASMLEKALRYKGNSVTRASSLAEGRQTLASGRFDLVVSDVVLGDGTGLELLDAARAAGVRTPFLFMTGNVMDASLIKHFEENNLPYLKKPFDLEDLFSAVGELLAKAGT